MEALNASIEAAAKPARPRPASAAGGQAAASRRAAPAAKKAAKAAKAAGPGQAAASAARRPESPTGSHPPFASVAPQVRESRMMNRCRRV